MNLAEALLAADAGKITKKATKQIEIPRLTEQFGVPFILELEQIPYRISSMAPAKEFLTILQILTKNGPILSQFL